MLRIFALWGVLIETFATSAVDAQSAQDPARFPRRLELVQELAIGTVDGPPEYAFGAISMMAIGSTGTFYLVDNADTQIRRYDATGRFRGLIGRAGAGPGEYRRILGMALHGDTLLLVFDPANGRINVYDTAGVYRRAIHFDRGDFFGEKAFAVDGAGLVYVRASLVGPGQGPPKGSQYIRMRIDGTIVDSLPLPVDANGGALFVLMTADGPRWSFSSRMIHAVAFEGGVVTANTSVYRITLNPSNGSPRVLERSSSPISVSGQERDEWEAWARYFGSLEGSRQTVKIPKTKPAIRDIIVDRSGRIWVNVYTKGTKRSITPRPASDPRPLLTIRENNVYDVFSAKGEYLGRAELPAQSLLLGVDHDKVWLRTEASGGEYVLTRFRVPGLSAH
jgi:hypothetical protein